jgi:hypothetical protein
MAAYVRDDVLMINEDIESMRGRYCGRMFNSFSSYVETNSYQNEMIGQCSSRRWWRHDLLINLFDKKRKEKERIRLNTRCRSRCHCNICCGRVATTVLSLSCLVLSCPVLSWLVLSCPVLSCLVLSCLVLSFLVFSFHHAVSCVRYKRDFPHIIVISIIIQ